MSLALFIILLILPETQYYSSKQIVLLTASIHTEILITFWKFTLLTAITYYYITANSG
jgi:hypothetical protein